jgi:hypothetical protein
MNFEKRSALSSDDAERAALWLGNRRALGLEGAAPFEPTDGLAAALQ